MADAASEARNATARATSTGSTIRPRGYQRSSWRSTSGLRRTRSFQSGVRTVPGRLFEPFARPSTGLRLSLARTDREQIAAGTRILGHCARQLLDNRPDVRGQSRIVV